MSLTDELQQIRTLSESIGRMAIVASTTGFMPSPPSTVEERARSIKKELKALSDEITQRLQQRINRST